MWFIWYPPNWRLWVHADYCIKWEISLLFLQVAWWRKIEMEVGG